MPSELFTENFPEGIRRVLNDKCSKPQEVQPPSLNSPKLGKSVFFQQQAPGPGRPRPGARGAAGNLVQGNQGPSLLGWERAWPLADHRGPH